MTAALQDGAGGGGGGGCGDLARHLFPEDATDFVRFFLLISLRGAAGSTAVFASILALQRITKAGGNVGGTRWRQTTLAPVVGGSDLRQV